MYYLYMTQAGGPEASQNIRPGREPSENGVCSGQSWIPDGHPSLLLSALGFYLEGGAKWTNNGTLD